MDCPLTLPTSAGVLGRSSSRVSGPVTARSSRRPESTVCGFQEDKRAAVAMDRRHLLSAAALLGLNAAVPRPAAAADTCTDFTTTASGLKYCDVKEGDGPSPVPKSIIRCHYTGRLASNNKVFDSSYDRGRPLSFKVGAREVIQGWDLGILGTDGIPPMKEGGKRVLIIPPELAYGSRSVGGGLIPANSTLVFEVALLGKPGSRR